MSSFEDRKKSFENKFAHDQELQFKVSARRNKYLGEWVSQILNFNPDQEKEYIQSVIKADFAEAGDQDGAQDPGGGQQDRQAGGAARLRHRQDL